MKRHIVRMGVLTFAMVTLVAACTGTQADESDEGNVAESDAISIEDAWVVAAEEGMSAGYGVLRNGSAADVTVESVESPASRYLELHETVENDAGESVMRQVQGGFVVPGAGSLTLEPGGDHIMLMDLTEPIPAGEEVEFVLTFADGSTFEFTASARDFAGGHEPYDGNESEHGAESQDHLSGSADDESHQDHVGPGD